jgi:F-type H+-transporting ATPase subunit delta
VALVAETLAGSRELRRALVSPDVPRAKKSAVLGALFGEKTTPLVGRFLKLVVSKGREEALADVLAAYQTQRDREQGIQEVSVRAAKPLSGADEAALVKRLESLTGNNVRLAVKVEPELIGGLVVRVGDTVYDGSVRNQLAALREQMQTARTVSRGDGAATAEPPRATPSA